MAKSAPMPRNVIRTKFAYGEIVDSKLGIIKTPFPIGERENIYELQGNCFVGKTNGEKYWFTYKDQPIGKPLVVSGTPVLEGTSYSVIIFDVGNKVSGKQWPIVIDRLNARVLDYLEADAVDSCNYTSRLLSVATPDDARRVEIATNLTFREAFELSKDINSHFLEDELRTRFAVSDSFLEDAKKLVVVEKTKELQKAPEWVTSKNGLKYYLSDSMRIISGAVKAIMDIGSHVNLLFKGNSGFGKTSMAEAMAAYLDYDFLRLNCAEMLDTVAWFGSHQAKDGTTSFVPSQFVKALQKGKYVIVFDEFNRVESWLHNTLFPLLDHARRTNVADMEIVAAPSIVFVMTMNEGSAFSGTFVLDAALANRVDITEVVTEPSLAIETQIVNSRVGENANNKRVVEAIRELRKFVNDPKNLIPVDVSTRSSIKVARLVNIGMSLKDALKFVVANNVQETENKPILDIINRF